MQTKFQKNVIKSDRRRSNRQKEELKDMYGKEFDGYLFEDAMEETDKLLEGKVAVREKEIEVNRDMNEKEEGSGAMQV